MTESIGMNVPVETKYIWFPVAKGAGRQKVCIYPLREPENRLFEFDLPVASDHYDFYAALPVEEFLGRTLTISVNFPFDGPGSLVFSDELPPPETCTRPLLHFTAQKGWINDPNGLLFDDGVWHMYYQYNPFDTKWGNMHWGHAISKDLTHWTECGIVLKPDENGTVFSGSALKDRENVTGHGWNAYLYFYTAAGGTNLWSESRKFTQFMAVSTDRGMTLQKMPACSLDTITRENRDPKVFYHDRSRAYIMVLFLDNNDFAIFRSEDLAAWTMTQRLTLPDAWECPDLFELPVEGTGRTAWVFWSADGYYFTGSFDGFRFVPDGPHRNAYIGSIPYAAQTFSGVKGRTVSVPWLRISPPDKPYAGIMGIPSELSLIPTDKLPCIKYSLPREFTAQRVKLFETVLSSAGVYRLPDTGTGPFEAVLNFPSIRGKLAIYGFGSHLLNIDFDTGTLSLDGNRIAGITESALDIDLIVDFDVIELRAKQDTVYCVCPNTDAAPGGLTGMKLISDSVCEVTYYTFS